MFRFFFSFWKNRFGPAGRWTAASRNLRPAPKFSPLRLFIIFLSGRQASRRAQEDGRKVQQQLPVAKSCQTPPTHTHYAELATREKSAASIRIYQLARGLRLKPSTVFDILTSQS